MTTLHTDEPLAIEVVDAIHGGDVARLKRLLHAHPGLAAARVGEDDADGGMSRTLLHVATDWPGHFPNVATTIALLVQGGADADGRFHGPHRETPLHWAASSNDVAALDALLDHGADIESDGAVLGGGPPLADARGFLQRAVALRLIERGATTTLTDAATLGLHDRLEELLARDPSPAESEIDRALWGACHGGELTAAQRLHAAGADLNWLAPWEPLTPLDAARRSGAGQVAEWLVRRGARSASR